MNKTASRIAAQKWLWAIAVCAALLIFALFMLFIAAKQSPSAKTMRTNSGVAQLSMGMMDEATASFDYAEEAGMDMPRIAPSPEPYDTAGETAADVEQKIIKTGNLSLVVDSVDVSVTAVTGVAATQDGYVESSSIQERTDGTRWGNIVIRVPASTFEQSMADIKEVANLVEHESASGRDVTEQYTDLQARLRNAEAQEETYVRLLDRADTVTDVLAVERELGSIRAQIESLQGRIQYLENKTSYSTISVSLTEEAVIKVPTKEFRPLITIRRAAQALVASLQYGVNALIWILVVGGGVLLPIALVIYVLRAIIRRIRH